MPVRQAPEAPTDDMDSLYAGSMGEGGEKEEGAETTDEENQEAMGSTTVVPLNVLKGPGGEPVKEGDEIVVKVKSVQGDQAVIYYAPHKPGEEEEEEPGKETPGKGEEMSPNDEIDQIDRMNEGY